MLLAQEKVAKETPNMGIIGRHADCCIGLTRGRGVCQPTWVDKRPVPLSTPRLSTARICYAVNDNHLAYLGRLPIACTVYHLKETGERGETQSLVLDGTFARAIIKDKAQETYRR